MGSSGGGAGAVPTPPQGTGSLSNSFNAYEKANDIGMGMGNTTSFGGQDVNVNSAYADQKGGSGFDWKGKLKDSLLSMANTKMEDLNSFHNSPLQTQYGGFQQTPNAGLNQFSSPNLYNQLMQQQMMNQQLSRVQRYKRGVSDGR